MITDIKHVRGRELGIGRRRKSARNNEFWAEWLGQHCPTHCPMPPEPSGAQPAAPGGPSRLGRPLDIKQVAAIIGCSPWSVRNTLIPKQGLPYFRFGASSPLIFYTDQVVRWIESQQQKLRR